MFHFIIFALGLVFGVIIGAVCAFVATNKEDKPLGSIIFDEAVSEDVPYLGVKNHDDLQTISERKIVKLRVEHIKANSQR